MQIIAQLAGCPRTVIGADTFWFTTGPPHFLLEAEMEHVVWRDAAILRLCKLGGKEKVVEVWGVVD